jgi:hypothetical protein
MKSVGSTVYILPTTAKNPRNGEGSFIRLKDGRIMYVYTKYLGEDWHDHAIAALYAIYSEDEGNTWTAPASLLEKDEKAENIMSASLFRMQNDELGIVYLRKEKMTDGGIACLPVFRYSADEGQTWSEFVFCGIPDGYYCVINDGVIVQKSGRILVPMSYHGLRADAVIVGSKKKQADIRFAYSNDNGRTWGMLDATITTPFDDNLGFAEPGVYEHKDGELWCWFRTAYGYQYESRSKDDGKTWSAPMPNLHFPSPDAPMRVKHVGKCTVAVFNPVPLSCVRELRERWGSGKRTPLICAISPEDAMDFKNTNASLAYCNMDTFFAHCFALETDPKNSFCYPAIIQTKDGFLVAYYDSDNKVVPLNACRIRKVLYSEIQDALAIVKERTLNDEW